MLDTGDEHIVAYKHSSSITILQLVALPAHAVPVAALHFPISAHIMVCGARRLALNEHVFGGTQYQSPEI